MIETIHSKKTPSIIVRGGKSKGELLLLYNRKFNGLNNLILIFYSGKIIAGG